MSQEEPRPLADEPHGENEPPAIGRPLVAWTLIVAFVGIVVIAQTGARRDVAQDTVGDLQRNVLRIQGQYLVAAAHTPGVSRQQLYEGAKPLNTGPLSQRLAFIVLAGELAGPAEALRQIDANRALLARQAEPPPESPLLDLLQRLYADYENGAWDAPSLNAAERAKLQSELGWFGALALAPQADNESTQQGPGAATDPARNAVLAPAWRTFLILVVVIFGMLAVAAAGLAGAIIFGLLAFTGKMASGIQAGSRHSAVYAETFALWMFLLFAFSGLAFLMPDQQGNRLLYSAAASLLSLAALAWPVVRGVPWPQVRAETGLYAGSTPLREVLWGFVCYASTLPLVAIGFLATLTLFRIQQMLTGGDDGFGQAESPAHPIIDWVQEAGFPGRLTIFVLACLIAPLVEEALFRGVLYRHLRDSTVRWRRGLSILAATGVNSLIFAVIHPQGLLAAPVLMSIAAGLSLAREWRGSLLTPMVMHGLNNGIMLSLLFMLL